MLSFHRSYQINLAAGRIKGPIVVSFDSEKENFGDISEIETNATAVGKTIFTDFFPDDIGLVFKAPCFENF